MLEKQRSRRKCLRSACRIVCLTTKLSYVMHSILKTSYFFDKVVEIDLLKVQYLRTTSEAFLINLFLQLPRSCGWRRGYSLWKLSAQLIRGLCQRTIQLFLPGCTSKYTILCWWIQHSAVGFFCAQKQDAVLCTRYSSSPKLPFWQVFMNKILMHWDFSAGSHDAQDYYVTLLRS